MKKSASFFFVMLICLVHCGAEQRHLESKHFIVSYPPEIEDTARYAIEIAEETAQTLAPFFGYRFAGKKIVVNVCDEADFRTDQTRTGGIIDQVETGALEPPVFPHRGEGLLGAHGRVELQVVIPLARRGPGEIQHHLHAKGRDSQHQENELPSFIQAPAQ